MTTETSRAIAGAGRDTPGATPATLTAAASYVLDGLVSLVDGDWSVRAGELEWSCWQTADHLVDGILSYCLQLAAQQAGDWLPLEEVHARAEATPRDLLDVLAAVCRVYSALLTASPPDATASDGVVVFGVADWAARGAYELLLHGYDIATGLDGAGAAKPPAPLCAQVLASPALWMLDRRRAGRAADPWEALLLGSGRAAPNARLSP